MKTKSPRLSWFAISDLTDYPAREMIAIAAAVFVIVGAIAPAKAESCTAPNITRAVIEAEYGSNSPLACPPIGLCYRTSWWTERADVIRRVCLTPEQEAHAEERAKSTGDDQSDSGANK